MPDQNLGGWVMEKTGRKMDLWAGNCYVHVEFTRQSIERIRDQYPDAPVVAHPECTFAVRLLADEVCSTEKMIAYCRDHDARRVHHRHREPGCSTGCARRCRTSYSSPARPTIAPARTAGS